MVSHTTKIGFGLFALTAFACKPDIPGRASVVDENRVLAVRSVPAEAAPGASIRYEALYVGGGGGADSDSLDWALCSDRKPIAVSGPIALECLSPEGDGLTKQGTGDAVDAKLPSDVCSTFGPESPTPKDGEPASRPVDPDSTGGYYQVVRVLAPGADEDAYSVGVTRLDCGLSGATPEQSVRFNSAHRANENPDLDSLVTDDDQTLEDNGDSTLTVKRGQHVTFHATWAECAETPDCESESGNCSGEAGCAGSEPYLVLDQASHQLVSRREAIRVSWFSNGGTFDHDRTGRTEDDAKNAFTENEWTAPNTPADYTLWVVIRDDRGGVGWRSYVITVSG